MLKSQVVTVCQDIVDYVDNGDRTDAIIIDFSKAFDLVAHGRLFMKIANSGMDSRVVVWIREFLLGHTQRVREGGHLSEEVRVTSGVLQGGVLGPLLFLAYVNDISRNNESTIRLFADDYVIYRKIINKEDRKVAERSGQAWAVENAMKINPSKNKAVHFTTARVKDPLDYSLANTLIPEASSCKYLGIILRSNLSWVDQINYMVKKAWKALHFTMQILKKGNSNTRSLAYMSLVRPILEYVAPCWEPCRGGQVTVLQGAKESSQICTSYEQFQLGNFGVA